MAPVTRWAKVSLAAFTLAAIAAAVSFAAFRWVGLWTGFVAAGACVAIAAVATVLAVAALVRIRLARGSVRGSAIPVAVLVLVALGAGGVWLGLRHAQTHGIDYRSPDGTFALRTGAAAREERALVPAAPLTSASAPIVSAEPVVSKSLPLLEMPQAKLDAGKLSPVEADLLRPVKTDSDAYPFESRHLPDDLTLAIQGACSNRTGAGGTWEAVKKLARLDFQSPSIEAVSASFARAVTADDRIAIVAIIAKVEKAENAEPLQRELEAELDRLHPKDSHAVVRHGRSVGVVQRLQDSPSVKEAFESVVTVVRRKVGDAPKQD